MPFKDDREQTAKGRAVFAQDTYQVTNDFNVTVGARYSRDEKQATYRSYAREVGVGVNVHFGR